MLCRERKRERKGDLYGRKRQLFLFVVNNVSNLSGFIMYEDFRNYIANNYMS